MSLNSAGFFSHACRNPKNPSSSFAKRKICERFRRLFHLSMTIWLLRDPVAGGVGRLKDLLKSHKHSFCFFFLAVCECEAFRSTMDCRRRRRRRSHRRFAGCLREASKRNPFHTIGINLSSQSLMGKNRGPKASIELVFGDEKRMCLLFFYG